VIVKKFKLTMAQYIRINGFDQQKCEREGQPGSREQGAWGWEQNNPNFDLALCPSPLALR